MNTLTRKDIDLMMSHVNSYSGENWGKSPVEMFIFLYGEEFAEKPGQTKIPPNEILLNPSLLKK